MTFLEICKRVASKAGIAGNTPASTVNQSGEALRIVNWVQDAYCEIQDKNPDWWFMRLPFTFLCTVGQSAYPKATVTDLANWKDNDVRCYLTTTDDEQWLSYRPWDEFRLTRLMGSSRTVAGRPQDFTVSPDRDMVLWPIPDAAYTIGGEYYQSAKLFVNDTDVPRFDRFHMAIVYKALEYYGAYSSEPSVYSDAQRNYERLLDKLEAEESDAPVLGGSLA